MRRIVAVFLMLALSLNSFPVYANSTADRLKSVTDKIGGAASDIADGAVDKASNVKDAAVEGAGRAKDAAVEGAGRAKDAAAEGAGRAKDAAVEGAGRAKDAAVEGAGRAKDAAVEGAGRAKDAAVEGAGRAKDAAVQGAGRAKDVATEGVGRAKDAAKTLFSKIDTSRFKSGWDYVMKHSSSMISAGMTQQNLVEVEKEVVEVIQNLENHINSSALNARDVAREKGFVFETWQADTFNIDAVANRSKEKAWTLGSNESGSVDVQTSYGESASMKVYEDGQSSAYQQAKRADESSRKLLDGWREYNSGKTDGPVSFKDYVDTQLSSDEIDDLFIAKYEGQSRIIPKDHMDDAIAYLNGKTTQLKKLDCSYSKAQQKVYEETLENLKDHLQAPDGTRSKALTSDDLQTITELAKKGEFKAEDFGIKPSDYITRADILSDVIKPAEQAAMLRVALSLGPDIYTIIVDAAKNGNIDEEKLKEAGLDAVLAGSEGFVEGSVSSTILLACKAGKFGNQFKNVSPDSVATLTVLAIDAARNGYKLAKGEITPMDYTNMMAEETFIAVASQATGIAVAAMLPMIPFAYLAGSMAGSMLASAGYSVGKDIVMEVKDTRGIGTILPSEVKGFNLGKDIIAKMNLEEKISSIKELCIMTKNNGTIVISKGQ